MRKRRQKKPDTTPTTTAIVKASRRRVSSAIVKHGTNVAWDKGSRRLVLARGKGKPLTFSRKEAQALCAYIAAVTNYENHCTHAGCFEPQVPGTSFCRFHRVDILVEGDDLVGMGGVLRG